ncbi:MAG: S1C family serine protease [Armatimonadota bacterium]|nr:S1C family serine protease [Armatimonadota bacterium]
MDILSDLSDGLASLVEAVGPSVVRVEARRRLPASGIAWSSDGLIVTADHAIEHEEGIRVGLADGRTVTAVPVGRDPSTDVALVRARATGLTPATWVEPGTARTGHLVVSLGRPGRAVRARLGILTAVADAWRAPGGAAIDRYLELDSGPAAGFSGGATVDASGGVLGMQTTGLLRQTALALPLPTLRRVADALLAHGRVRRGYLGIGGQPVRLPVGLCRDLGQEVGLLLVSVEPGSPAEAAGLLLGDVMLAVGDEPIGHLQDLFGLLTAERIGTAVPVRILRGGEPRELSVVIGERR